MNLIPILEDNGYIGPEDLKKLAVEYPALKVGIKFGQSYRIALPAGQAEAEIARRVADGDYVREVFIPCDIYDKLREALGLGEAKPMNFMILMPK
jgi:hypothetical protein